MFKRILIVGLIAVVVIAIAVSTYNVIAGSASEEMSSAVTSTPVSYPVAGTAEPVANPQVGAYAQGTGEQASAAGQSTGAQAGGAGQSRGRQIDAAAQSGGQGKRYGQGGRGQGQASSQGAGAQAGVPNPQAVQNEAVTLHGVVSNYTAPSFTLITDDGQSVAIQLGNQGFVSNLGITLQAGDTVTVVGFYETGDSFAASTLTLDASGETYVLRDQASGRPMWAGGPKNH
jgi:hypothetical protein